MDIPIGIQMAVDYAARDIARAIVDDCNCHTEYSVINRSVAFMLRASVAGVLAKQSAREEIWLDPSAKGWLTRAAETGPGGLNNDAVKAALQEWWGGLDDEKKYTAMKSLFQDSEVLSRYASKLVNKQEGDLSTIDPKLLEIYRSKAGGAAKPAAPKPDAPAGDLPPEKAKAPEQQRAMNPQSPDPGQQSQPPAATAPGTAAK